MRLDGGLTRCRSVPDCTRARGHGLRSGILDFQRAGVGLEDEPFELIRPLGEGDGDLRSRRRGGSAVVRERVPVGAGLDGAAAVTRRGARARAAAVGQRGRGEQRQRHRRQRQESTRHHGCRLSRGRAATVSPRRRVHRRHLTTTRGGCDTLRAPRERVRYSARAARQCRPRRATRRFLLFPSDDR